MSLNVFATVRKVLLDLPIIIFVIFIIMVTDFHLFLLSLNLPHDKFITEYEIKFCPYLRPLLLVYNIF